MNDAITLAILPLYLFCSDMLTTSFIFFKAYTSMYYVGSLAVLVNLVMTSIEFILIGYCRILYKYSDTSG